MFSRPNSNRPFKTHRRIATSCLTAALALIGTAHGQTNNWQWQVGSNDWSAAGNWQYDATGEWGLYELIIGPDNVNSPPYAATQISTGSFMGTTLASSVGLNMLGGSLTLTSSTQTSSISGTLTMSGGTLSTAGALNVTNLNLSGGVLSGAGSVNVASSFTMSGASGSNLIVSTTLNLAGAGTWNTASSISNAGGSFNILNGASLSLSGAGIINNGSFSNAGTLTYAATTVPAQPLYGAYYGIEATVASNSGTIIDAGVAEGDFWSATTTTNTGTFNDEIGGGNINGSGNWMTVGANLELLNEGTIESTAAGSAFQVYANTGLVDNEGTIEVLADNSIGEVIGNSEVLNNGKILFEGQNETGDVYALSGPTVNNGKIVLKGTGTLSVGNAGFQTTNSGLILVDGAGTITINGNGGPNAEFVNEATGKVVAKNGGNFVYIDTYGGTTINYGLMKMGNIDGNYSDSFLDMSTSITNYGTYADVDTTGDWPFMQLGNYQTGSTIDNEGLLLADHATLETNQIGAGSMLNNGQITVQNGGSYYDNSTTLTNSSTGSININGNGSSLFLTNAAGTFTNNGSLTVSGAYSATVADQVVNTGTMTVYSGAPLQFNNPVFTNSGLVTGVNGGWVDIADHNGQIVNEFSSDPTAGIVANAGTVAMDFDDGTVGGDNGSTQNYGLMSSINGGTLDDRSTNFTNESTGSLVVANPLSYMEVGSAAQASTVVNNGSIDVSAVGGSQGSSTFFSNRYSNANNPAGFQSSFTNNNSIYVHDEGSWSDNSGLLTNNGTIWTENSALVYLAGQGGTFVNTGTVGSRSTSTIVINPQGDGLFQNIGGSVTAARNGNLYDDSTNIENLSGGFIMGYGGSQLSLDYPTHWANDITNDNSYIGADWGETDLFSVTIENQNGATLEARDGGYLLADFGTLTNTSTIDVYWPSYDNSHMSLNGGFINNTYQGSIIANQSGTISTNLDGPSGSLFVNNGFTEAENGGQVLDDSATFIQGGTLLSTTGGNIVISGAAVSNYWDIQVDPNSYMTVSNGYQQLYSLAVTTVNGVMNVGGNGLVLGDGVTAGDGGTLNGSGQINGTVWNKGGIIAPTGTLTAQNLVLDGGTISGPGTLVAQYNTYFGTNPNEVITNSANLVLQGEAQQDQYNIDVENWGGTVTVDSGSVFNFYSVGLSTGSTSVGIGTGAGFVGGSFVNNGTMNMNESPGVYIAANGNWFETENWTNNGAINIGGNNLPVDMYGVESSVNTGTLTASGASEEVTMGTYGVGNTLLNSGTMTYAFTNSDGQLYSWYGNIENAGTIQISGTNSTFEVFSGFQGTGTTFQNDAAAQFIVSGQNFATINELAGSTTQTVNYGLIEMEFSGGNSGDALVDNSANIVNYGTYEVQDVPGGPSWAFMGLGTTQSATIDNEGQFLASHGTLWTNAGGIGTLYNNGTIQLQNNGFWSDYGASVTNSVNGAIKIDGGSAALFQNYSGTFTNNGAVTVTNGSTFSNPGTTVNNASMSADSGSQFVLNGPVTNNGSITVTNGSAIGVHSTGAVNTGTISIDSTSTGTFDSGYTQLGAAAKTTVKGALNVGGGGLVLGDGVTAGDGGILTGNGTIFGSVTNLSGTIEPGDPQILTIDGDFSQGTNGRMVLDILGNGAAGAVNGYDQINVLGSLTLQGAIDLTVGPDYTGGPVNLFTYTGSLTIIGTVDVVDLSNPADSFVLTPADNGTGGGAVGFQSTPEPASFLPLGLGLGILALRRRKRAA